MYAIPFPAIDPVLVEIGPYTVFGQEIALAIRWYALAYIGGLLLGWRYMRVLAGGPPKVAEARDIDDFLMWATLGVVVGGRIGFVILYTSLRGPYFIDNPLAIFEVWRGGMAFHGGLLGVIVVTLLFCRARRIPLLAFGDIVACAAPIGLFLGRVANFINGELVGRPTDVPWGMVFPGYGPEVRHPSQLYEAALEGVALFVLLFLLWRVPRLRARHGLIAGAFLVGYAVARSFAEEFRATDPGIGLMIWGTTWAQWVSVPMVILGLWLILRTRGGGGSTPT